MRSVIQRVSKASVQVDEEIHASIQRGLLVFLGIEDRDDMEDVRWLVKKIAQLRIFGDENGIMNLALNEVGGEILVISQFTLHASTKKGNRPSYIKAAKPDFAIPLYEAFINELKTYTGKRVRQGIFGAHMAIDLVNDGPVTLIIDTKNKE